MAERFGALKLREGTRMKAAFNREAEIGAAVAPVPAREPEPKFETWTIVPP
jgi:hypothetical protein